MDAVKGEDLSALLADLLREDMGEILAPLLDDEAMNAALAEILQEAQEDATP